MSDTPERSAVERLARAAAHHLLAELHKEGVSVTDKTITATQDVDVVVIVGLLPFKPDTMFYGSPCERDILCVLAGRTGRLSGTKILQLLEQHGLIHGDSTVKRALGRLVKDGLIKTSRKTPIGYWIEIENEEGNPETG